MSLDTILQAIRDSGQAQVREIEARAQIEIERIIAQAKTEADTLFQEARNAVLNSARGDEARILQQARLASLQIIGDAQMTLVNQALERATEHLAGLRDEPIYPQLFRHLMTEALDALRGSLLEGEIAHLEADPRDQQLMVATFGELKFEQPVTYNLRTWGGVVATSADGRIVVDNTLETRLERAKPALHGLLCKLLESEVASSRQ